MQEVTDCKYGVGVVGSDEFCEGLEGVGEDGTTVNTHLNFLEVNYGKESVKLCGIVVFEEDHLVQTGNQIGKEIA